MAIPIITAEKIGLSGLYNINNTCFLNTALQCLSNTPRLKNFFCDKKFNEILADALKINSPGKDFDIIKNKTMSGLLSSLIFTIWTSPYSVIRPITFYNYFIEQNREYADGKQHDVHEAIKSILDAAHEELAQNVAIQFPNMSKETKQLMYYRNSYLKLKESKDSGKEVLENAKMIYEKYKEENLHANLEFKSYKYWKKYIKAFKCSVITEIFDSITLRCTECSECKKKSYVYDTIRFLQVPIPNLKKITLQDCLNAYCNQEILEGREKYKCDHCNKKVNACTNVSLWETADIITIQFKRFIKRDKDLIKNCSEIIFPLELDVKPYIAKESFLNREKKTHVYKLYAIANHHSSSEIKSNGMSIGNMNSGHYTAYCENQNDRGWYHFDDDRTRPVKTETIFTKDAYVLFYKISS